MAVSIPLPFTDDRRPSAGMALVRRTFSFPVMLAFLLAGGACLAAHFRFVDPDTWWHIFVGDQILRTGTWPLRDIHSFTVPGADWIAYEWLGEVILAAAARLGGFHGLAALQFLLASTLMVLLYYYATLRCSNMKAAFIACTIALPGVAAFFTLRPQLLGYAFLLVTMISLERYRIGRTKNLWFLPPLFLVWVNTHGTFALGALVVGMYWLGGLANFRKGGLTAEPWSPRQRRHLLVIMLLCLLVAPMTPYGTRLAAYPLQMAFTQPLNVASIMEWQPMSFDLLLGKVILTLLLLFFLAQVVWGLTYRLETMVLLLLGVFGACVHIRFILFFLFLFVPLLATMLARWVPGYEPRKDQRGLNAIIMLSVLIAMCVYLTNTHRLKAGFTRTYPVEAVRYLREHPVPGPMLNNYGWGGYLIWSFGADRKVFIDGRGDLYEYGGVLSDYMHIVRLAPDTLFLLRKYGVSACLIDRKSPLETFLAALPDWQRVYADDVATLYVRRSAEPPPPARAQ